MASIFPIKDGDNVLGYVNIDTGDVYLQKNKTKKKTPHNTLNIVDTIKLSISKNKKEKTKKNILKLEKVTTKHIKSATNESKNDNVPKHKNKKTVKTKPIEKTKSETKSDKIKSEKVKLDDIKLEEVKIEENESSNSYMSALKASSDEFKVIGSNISFKEILDISMKDRKYKIGSSDLRLTMGELIMYIVKIALTSRVTKDTDYQYKKYKISTTVSNIINKEYGIDIDGLNIKSFSDYYDKNIKKNDEYFEKVNYKISESLANLFSAPCKHKTCTYKHICTFKHKGVTDEYYSNIVNDLYNIVIEYGLINIFERYITKDVKKVLTLHVSILTYLIGHYRSPVSFSYNDDLCNFIDDNSDKLYDIYHIMNYYKKPVKEPVKDSIKEPVKDLVKVPVKESSVKESSVKESSVKEKVKDVEIDTLSNDGIDEI